MAFQQIVPIYNFASLELTKKKGVFGPRSHLPVRAAFFTYSMSHKTPRSNYVFMSVIIEHLYDCHNCRNNINNLS
jgi:hypothetical protein